MREIKFRVWDKHLKQIRSVKKIYFLADSKCAVTVRDGKQLSVDLNWDEMEIMQFTGLKDKNGKEIYEGDIVQYQYDDGNYCGVRKKPVEFGEFEFYPFNDVYNWDSLEIVGNIYENPELVTP